MFPSGLLTQTPTPTLTRSPSLLSPSQQTSAARILEDGGIPEPDGGDILMDAPEEGAMAPGHRNVPGCSQLMSSPRYSNCQHEKVSQK